VHRGKCFRQAIPMSRWQRQPKLGDATQVPATRETGIESLDAKAFSVDEVFTAPNGRIVRANLRRIPQ